MRQSHSPARKAVEMAATSYGLRELAWDTALFGMKMGEVIINSGHDAGGFALDIWQNTMEDARRQAYQFLLCQLDARYRDAAAALISQGAVTGDTLVTLELNFNEVPEVAATTLESVPAELQVTTAGSGDLPAICDIAAGSFIHSRIYQDTRFDRTKARQFYPQWIRDSFGTSEIMYALKDKTGAGPVLGFISLQYQEGERRVVIRLIAVDEQHRNSGYGQAMMDWLIRDALKRGFVRIQVGTQANNTAAIRLYEKNGFRPISTKYRFHIWLSE
jgi:ribosomal protein S18 acetylase RimI-like enzyme